MGTTYSVTGVEIRLKRQIKPIIMNVYFPSGALVAISFISFLIPVGRLQGRLSLVGTIFLMLVTISASERRNGPRVHYRYILNCSKTSV